MKTKEDLHKRIATFRFGLIADFVGGARLGYGEKERLLREKTERTYEIPGSHRTRVSRAALLLWVSRYKMSGERLESLMPRPRSDKGTYRGIDPTIVMTVRRLKGEDPTLTLPALLAKLVQMREISSAHEVNRASLYRFIKKERLGEAISLPVDRRKFEAEFPNELWQCDVLHGPMVTLENGSKKKSYLVAIIDDHSRLVVHAEFLLSESFAALRTCLKKALEKRGLPRKFYVDNGACYRSNALEHALALLGVALVHSRPFQPQGRGKIERWFRTVRMNFFKIHVQEEMPLSTLNEKFWGWLESYNSTEHSATSMSPESRFRAGIECLRPAPADLLSYFRKVELRRVKKDRTLRLEGILFEVPVSLIGKTVQARYHEEDPSEVEIFFEERSFGFARKLDLVVNSRVGRDALKNKLSTEHQPAPCHEKPLIQVQSGELFSSRSDVREVFHEH